MITDYEISYTMADGSMAESLRSAAIVTGKPDNVLVCVINKNINDAIKITG